MDAVTSRAELLARTNPLFGSRPLKLGTFASNASGGCTMSSIEGALTADWQTISAVSRMADEMEFEAVVPVGRWRGFGGETDFNGHSMECFTFAAATGAQTRHPAVFSTAHVPTIHPVLAAKQGSTIDHVSGGRFTLNIVTGWYTSEIEIFGAPLLEHDERYAMADEWVEIIKRIWSADDPVSFEGKYYRVKDAFLRPRPVQQPYPALMSAGASKAGQMFAAKHADVAFTSLEERTPEAIRPRLDGYRNLARTHFNRDIKVWINAYIIQGDTEADAQRQYDRIVHEKGDWAGANNLLTTLGLNSQSLSPEILAKVREDFVAGWGGYRLMGTKAQIVDGFKMLVAGGVDGVLLGWPAYVDGMRQFQEEIHPLLVQEGLR